ncbi:hypothetical protein ACQP3L_33750, partial [Escherichia coli]
KPGIIVYLHSFPRLQIMSKDMRRQGLKLIALGVVGPSLNLKNSIKGLSFQLTQVQILLPVSSTLSISFLPDSAS